MLGAPHSAMEYRRPNLLPQLSRPVKVHGERPCQGRRFRGRRERDGSECQPLSRQGDENRSMPAMPQKRRLAVKASSVAIGQEGTFAELAASAGWLARNLIR